MQDDIPAEYWPQIEARVLEIADACYAAGVEDGAGIRGVFQHDTPIAAIVAEARRRFHERIGGEIRAVLPGWFRGPGRRLP